MLLTLFLFMISFSTTSNASWNVIPDQTINISVKYDQDLQQFYELSASGSDLIVVDIIDNNQIKIKHGRDGYKGKRIPNTTWVRPARNTNLSRLSQTLVGRSMNESIDVKVGTGNSEIYGAKTTNYTNNGGDGRGCKTTDTWSGSFKEFEILNTKIDSVYNADWCLGSSFRTTQYENPAFPNNGGEIGYIERYFKFPLSFMNNLPFDNYFGIYEPNPQADVLRNDGTGGGLNDLGREAYRYVISVEIKPSINAFTVDNENVSFSVSKQKNRIIGKVQTGFNIRGSFHNSQAFDMTFVSLNNVLCGGNLCLSNTTSKTRIPYQVRVLDPSNLQEKVVSLSGQKVTIYSDKDFQVSGGLFFEFETDDSSLSGTFNDIVTIRAELKIM